MYRTDSTIYIQVAQLSLKDLKGRHGGPNKGTGDDSKDNEKEESSEDRIKGEERQEGGPQHTYIYLGY